MRRDSRTAAMAVMMAVLAAGPALAGQPQRERRPPDTDQTVNAARGARLSVSNRAGEVLIRTWDRDVVRVAARHGTRIKVAIRTTPAGIAVSSSGPGLPSVDYEITAPVWMPVVVDGQYNYVSIEGAQSEVTATTVRGDIIVKGGTGSVRARSIEGEIVVDGAKGRIVAESVNEGIRILNSSGDILAETTNGDITLSGAEATSVEVSTVNGNVRFEGRLATGRYRFVTHNGNITLAVPEASSATFSVRTYQGSFRTNLPLQGASSSDARRGRRVTFTLGAGSADVELETFNGGIRILRPGTQPDRTRN